MGTAASYATCSSGPGAPFLLRNDLVAVDGPPREARTAERNELKRVGKDAVIVQLAADGGARVELAAARHSAVGARWRALLADDDQAPRPDRAVDN